MPDDIPTVTDVYEAVRRMNHALSFEDRLFTIRDTEMRGDEGPRVQSWRWGLDILKRAGLLGAPTSMMIVHQSAPLLLGVQRCTRCGETLYDVKTSTGEPWRGRVRVFLGRTKTYVPTTDPATCIAPVDDREPRDGEAADRL